MKQKVAINDSSDINTELMSTMTSIGHVSASDATPRGPSSTHDHIHIEALGLHGPRPPVWRITAASIRSFEIRMRLQGLRRVSTSDENVTQAGRLDLSTAHELIN